MNKNGKVKGDFIFKERNKGGERIAIDEELFIVINKAMEILLDPILGIEKDKYDI